MKQHIYADNAATTILDGVAFEAMMPWLQQEYGNASQPYSFARGPKQALSDARSVIAECIGASPTEIYFTSGGTEGDNWVIKSSAFSDREHRATITSAFEHHAVLHSCASVERLGYPVAYMWPSNGGYITKEILEGYISNRTRLVSVMFVNNEIGNIQPVRDLASVAHAHGALFHTDAVQALGHIRVNVHELGIDFLSASAHKFNGPKGIGFLYIRNGVELKPYADGGAQEFSHRGGTENVPAIVGMAAALKANCNSLEENQRHILRLERKLLAGLDQSGIHYRLNSGKDRLPGLLSLSFPGKDGEMILHRMDLMGISISTGSACNSVNTDISHVLKAIRLDEEYAKGTIRISLGKYNTGDDIDTIVTSLIRILM